MIDPHNEDLITPTQLARLRVFSREGSKPAHITTVWRWINLGSRDRHGHRVKLETIRTPRGTMTSLQAVDRWLAALNCIDVTEQPSPTRVRDVAAAERELAAAGIV